MHLRTIDTLLLNMVILPNMQGWAVFQIHVYVFQILLEIKNNILYFNTFEKIECILYLNRNLVFLYFQNA